MAKGYKGHNHYYYDFHAHVYQLFKFFKVQKPQRLQQLQENLIKINDEKSSQQAKYNKLSIDIVIFLIAHFWSFIVLMIIGKQVVTVFSFSLAKNSVNLSKNYYKILEVDTACDQKLIKKSYLKLVKTLHPDVNPSGKQKFTQVQQAYQVLSDQQLKQYYDKNNYMKASSMNGSQQNKAYSSRAYQTSSGHQYHTHRTYQSDNPHDYFYTDNEFRKKAQNPKQNKDFQQDEEKSNNGFKDNFDYQAKRAKSQASWEEYQRQKQKREEDEFGHETLEQRKMRDKIKAMRGFTSSYNVLWARHHIRHTDLQGNDQRMRKKQQQIRNLMPQKVRKLYDKLMDRIEKIATG